MLYESSPSALCRFMNVYETWIHCYTTETNEQLKQWAGEATPKNLKADPLTRKVMAIVYWDSQDIILLG